MNLEEDPVQGDLVNLVMGRDLGDQGDLMGQNQEDPHQEVMKEVQECENLLQESGHQHLKVTREGLVLAVDLMKLSDLVVHQLEASPLPLPVLDRHQEIMLILMNPPSRKVQSRADLHHQ